MNTFFATVLAAALLAAAPHAANARSSASRGVAADEQTALLIDGSGHVSVVGRSAAYFLQALAGFVVSLQCAGKFAQNADTGSCLAPAKVVQLPAAIAARYVRAAPAPTP